MSALPVSAALNSGAQRMHLTGADEDVRSVRLKDEIQREWKQLKKTASPGERMAWINRQETIIGMAARQRADILIGLDFIRETIERDVPSSSWFDAAWNAGEQFPPGGHRATGMVKSRAKTRIGNDGRMSRRMMPPQCVGEEDLIDQLSINEASYLSCIWPASVSALAIIRIVPLGPFSVTSLVAGIVHVRRRAYLLGTALGMFPGIALNALFIDRILAAIRAPSPTTMALAAAAAAACVALVLILRRRLAHSE